MKKQKNPVAKFMNQFNKPVTHKDRTKYNRKEKHKKGRNKADPYFLQAA